MSVTWAALCECSFEVGERSEVGALEGTTLSLYVKTLVRTYASKVSNCFQKDRLSIAYTIQQVLKFAV